MLRLFLCIALGTPQSDAVKLWSDLFGRPPHLFMWSASLCRSSVLIDLRLKVCKGFVSHWLGSRTFWTLSKAAEKGQLVPMPKFKETKWSSFCWKSFSAAHIGISSFNMIFFLFKVMQWRMNACLPACLSAPRSLHLPYESNSSWRSKRKKNNTTILDKLLQSKMFLFQQCFTIKSLL